MKRLFFVLITLFSVPGFALTINLTPEEEAQCVAEGGCMAISEATAQNLMEQFEMMMHVIQEQEKQIKALSTRECV